jgi:hypothetical protein
LSGIEVYAFSEIDLVEIILPASVEFLGKECFCKCRSRSSVTFEIGSPLLEIEKEALRKAGWVRKAN